MYGTDCRRPGNTEYRVRGMISTIRTFEARFKQGIRGRREGSAVGPRSWLRETSPSNAPGQYSQTCENAPGFGRGIASTIDLAKSAVVTY